MSPSTCVDQVVISTVFQSCPSVGVMVRLSVLLPGVFPQSGHGNCFEVAWQYRQTKERCCWQITGLSIGVVTSNSSHLIISLPSISFSPFIPRLTSSYLTAKTNCLVVGIRNSSYSSFTYTHRVLFLYANKEKVCKPQDANIMLTVVSKF